MKQPFDALMDCSPQSIAPSSPGSYTGNASSVEARMMEAYSAGMDDAGIARYAHVGGSTVWAWRQKQGFHANVFGADLTVQLTVQAAYNDGLTDEEIVSRSGAEIYQVEKWRRQRHLPQNGTGKDIAAKQIPLLGPFRWDRGLAQRLYCAGANDKEIAKTVGVSSSTIRNWRVTLGLEAQYHRNPKTTELQDLYGRGCSDKALAAETGCSLSQVRKWRQKLGLRPNSESQIHDERLQLYEQGMSDGQIARVVGRSPTTIQAWRKRNGLEPNCPCWAQKEWDEAAALALYQEGHSDRYIASQLGITAGAIGNWRKRNGFPAHTPGNVQVVAPARSSHGETIEASTDSS